MSAYVLDSYPLLELLENGKKANQVQQIIEEAEIHRKPLYLSVVNWAEVYYISVRNVGKTRAGRIMRDLETLPIELVDADQESAHIAGEIKAEGGISLADCFAASLAKLKNAILVTGDEEFRRLSGFVKILWL